MDNKYHVSTFSILKLRSLILRRQKAYNLARRENALYWEPFIPYSVINSFSVALSPESASRAQMKRSSYIGAVTLKGGWAAISNIVATNLCSQCQDPWALSFNDRIIYCHRETPNDGTG